MRNIRQPHPLRCCRSAEGRKRITLEIVRTLSANTDQKPPAGFGRPSAAALAAIPFKQKAGFPPPYKVVPSHPFSCENKNTGQLEPDGIGN